MPQYDRLPPLDSTFLYAESSTAHMHVGSLSLYEDPKISEAELVAHIERRLHLVPRYRQKIALVPGNQGRPVWVDDPHFHVNNHVFFTGVPISGDEGELMKLAARLLSRPLDRSKPLWEIWHMYMKDGRRAIVTKSHHCLVDGISAVDIGAALLDFGPEPQEFDVPPWLPQPEPSRSSLLRDAVVERFMQPRQLVESLASKLSAPRELARKSFDLGRGLFSFTRSGLSLAPRTSFTKQIGPHRRYDVVRADLPRIKTIRAAFGCTVNDVVLAAVAGGVRRLLLSRNESVDGLVLRALVPVNFRAESERNTFGNKVSWVLADLPVGEPDPRKRVERANAAMRYLKTSKQALGADFWFRAAEYSPPTALSLTGRFIGWQRMANLVITNVPGPQFPLYLRGARMLEAFPVVPIAGVTSLGVAILSYDGKVTFGLNADWDLFPDLHVLSQGIRESLDEFEALVTGQAVPASTPPPGTEVPLARAS